MDFLPTLVELIVHVPLRQIQCTCLYRLSGDQENSAHPTQWITNKIFQ